MLSKDILRVAFTLMLPFIIVTLISIFACSESPLHKDYDKYESTLVLPKTKPIETEILTLINSHRDSLGLNILQTEPTVKSVAHRHTIDMISENLLSHNGFFERSDYLKYRTGATRVGENLAYGYTSANSVFNAWLKSQAHRENLEGNYTHFDISVEINKEGKTYITVGI